MTYVSPSLRFRIAETRADTLRRTWRSPALSPSNVYKRTLKLRLRPTVEKASPSAVIVQEIVNYTQRKSSDARLAWTVYHSLQWPRFYVGGAPSQRAS